MYNKITEAQHYIVVSVIFRPLHFKMIVFMLSASQGIVEISMQHSIVYCLLYRAFSSYLCLYLCRVD